MGHFLSNFDKYDLYVAVATAVLILGLLVLFRLANRGGLFSIHSLQDLSALANSKGGIVILLTAMWFFTLIGTVTFGVWVLVRGIDPQHAVVVTILGMLISQAFGNVNGALFKTMTGEDIKPKADSVVAPVVPPVPPPG